MIIIGDVHGHFQMFDMLVRKFTGEQIIQVGDLGIGFGPLPDQTWANNVNFIRGNHDNPERCREYESYQGDYGYDASGNFFWVAGAFSMDRDLRIEGISWWADEELSYSELGNVIDLYEFIKPDYVLTHEAPAKAGKCLLYGLKGSYFAEKNSSTDSRTAQALQNMLDIHQPKEWVFGHYHFNHSFAVPFYNTKFTCVDELSTYELNTG